MALSKARTGLVVICVQTALQASGRCLEWESLLFLRQGKFWEACRLLCTLLDSQGKCGGNGAGVERLGVAVLRRGNVGAAGLAWGF